MSQQYCHFSRSISKKLFSIPERASPTTRRFVTIVLHSHPREKHFFYKIFSVAYFRIACWIIIKNVAFTGWKSFRGFYTCGYINQMCNFESPWSQSGVLLHNRIPFDAGRTFLIKIVWNDETANWIEFNQDSILPRIWPYPFRIMSI